MSFKSNFVVALFVCFFFSLFFFHCRGLRLFEKSRARNKTKLIPTSIAATKLAETPCVEGPL